MHGGPVPVIQQSGEPMFQDIIMLLQARLLPQGLTCWVWGIIIVVLYFVNVIMSARVLLPVGLPESRKPGRIKWAFILSLLLSWPLVYVVVVVLMEQGSTASAAGLAGSLAGWAFCVIFDFIANWKLFETYFPIRQKLGGSEAYANLHRHVWGHLTAIIAAVIAALGILLWWLAARLGA
jgi:hypothetical protein